jgi:hypothetical protein
MENTPPPPETKLNSGKGGGVNLTAVVVAVIVCVTVLAAIYLVNNKPKPAVAEAAPSRPAPGIVEKGLAVTGLQKAEGGQASMDYYNKYMDEQVTCQMIAGSIRGTVEKVDLRPSPPSPLGIQMPSPHINGVRKGLEIAAGYYRRSVRNKLSLSSAGIDPAIVSYVEKLAGFDHATASLYDEYARTLQSKAREIEAIGDARDAHVSREEAALIAGFQSKFGLQLRTREQIREKAFEKTSSSARQFLDKKSPQELAANLLGQSFNNLNSYGSWEVEAGEYVFGRVMDSHVDSGVAVVDLEVQLKGSRSNNPGLIRTRTVYVADAERNLYWAVLVQDISGR